MSSTRVNAAGRRRGVKGLRGEGVKRWEGEKVGRCFEDSRWEMGQAVGESCVGDGRWKMKDWGGFIGR